MKLLIALAVVLPALQDAHNPDYERWASSKVGSWVKYKAEIENGGNKMALPTETTMTVVEVDQKQVVIEEVTVNPLQPKDSPKQEKPRKRTYKATRAAKEGAAKEGDDDLEVAGKKLACHWTEVAGAGGSVKAWVNPEVPGAVKIEVGLPSKGLHRLTATSWEKK